jgi:hypothetical protein
LVRLTQSTVRNITGAKTMEIRHMRRCITLIAVFALLVGADVAMAQEPPKTLGSVFLGRLDESSSTG